jgi:hypothetical protein
MVTTHELIDETYVKWGTNPNNLNNIGKRYFATLSLYKDEINIDNDGMYYLKIVAKIGGKEQVYGPYPFYGKQNSPLNTASSRGFNFYGMQNSELNTLLPQGIQSEQTQGERTIQIYPEGTYREYETRDSTACSWDGGSSTSDTQSHLWIGVKTTGAPCTEGAIITDNLGGTTSGRGFCNNNNLSFEWDRMNFNSSSSIEEVVPRYNIDAKSSCTSHQETNNIISTITYQLPAPKANEMIKSVVIMSPYVCNSYTGFCGNVPYNIMDKDARYTLGGQLPILIGDPQCPEQKDLSSPYSCNMYTNYEGYGLTCNYADCGSDTGFMQSPCTPLLTWDVSALAPTMGGTLQLELQGSGNLPITFENSYSDILNIACTDNSAETYSQERAGEGRENYISLPYGGLPYALVTYKCEQEYTINITGELTYGNFIPPFIPYDWTSGISIPVQLTPVCGNENEDLSNKTIVFNIKRVDSGDETVNGGHTHNANETSDGAIGYFDSDYGSNECTTDSSGTCDVLWYPPEATGLYELTVYVAEKPDVTNTQRFMVGEEGLTSLVTSSYYRLTGDKPWHPDNHWAMEDVIGNIQRMASDFYNNNDATLGINDMSLIYGGVFDLDRDWEEPHNLHRLGRSIDIDSHAFSTDKKIYLPVDKREIARLCQEYGDGHLEPEATMHCEYPPVFYASGGGGGGGGCGDHPCM